MGIRAESRSSPGVPKNCVLSPVLTIWAVEHSGSPNGSAKFEGSLRH